MANAPKYSDSGKEIEANAYVMPTYFEPKEVDACNKRCGLCRRKSGKECILTGKEVGPNDSCEKFKLSW